MASGHVNRTKRPNTWLHRPTLQNVKKALANPEPSTHGTFRTCRIALTMSVDRGRANLALGRVEVRKFNGSCKAAFILRELHVQSDVLLRVCDPVDDQELLMVAHIEERHAPGHPSMEETSGGDPGGFQIAQR